MKMMKGTVDVLILKALFERRRHGYAVSSWIRERSDGVLGLEDAALYQALHRLEAKGLIASEWGTSENNRKAKYYSLTSRGEKRLLEASGAWRRYARAVFKVLDVI